MLMDVQPHADPATDYDLLEAQVRALLSGETDFVANAANFAAFVYHSLTQVNWAGFYFPDGDDLLLGPFGGKPACVRLPGGHGVCGAAFSAGKTLVVPDVDAFGDHIVCDSASKSEIVVPLLSRGAKLGVFDIDSPVLDRFDEADRFGLERLVRCFLELTKIPDRYRRVVNANELVNQRIGIQTCRDHHVVIRYLTEEINSTDPDGHTIPALLKRLRTVLFAHLKLEDDWLYPRLADSENDVVRRKAERYAREMGELKEHFTQLYEAWNLPGAVIADQDRWKQEWSGFSRALEARIMAEDDDLYVAAETETASN